MFSLRKKLFLEIYNEIFPADDNTIKGREGGNTEEKIKAEK